MDRRALRAQRTPFFFGAACEPRGKLLVLKLNRNRIDFARGLGDAEGTAATGLRALTNLQARAAQTA